MTAKKLPPTAYELKEGEQYVPFTHGQDLTEFTLKATLAGIILGLLFGAANTYLGLKAGLTISTSIPVAVLTVVAFRVFTGLGLRHSILECNMSQTIGSASSSVASGVLFTIPALFIWGMNPAWRQITLLAMCGGLIGVLAMIPLRRYLIKREHGRLPYPEGMACAEVLVASEEGGKQASGVFWGIGVGMLFMLITNGFNLVQGTFRLALGFKANIAVGVSPPLIGVGYILGIRIATVMVTGGALSALVIIPLINWWGAGLTEPLFPETVKLIRDMSAGEIWNRYVRYIGAGAVATGGIITLIRSIPTMIESFRLGLKQIGELVGVITSAGVVCLVVMLLHQNVAGGLGGEELPAPQAVLMKLVIDGVLEQNLPWALILIGVGIGLVAALFRIPVLAFAVGVYLPMSTMAAVFLGGLTRYLLTRAQPAAEAERRREQGVLFGAGLVGGGGLTGVLLALWVGIRGGKKIEGFPLDLPEPAAEALALLAIAAILGIMAVFVKGRRQA